MSAAASIAHGRRRPTTASTQKHTMNTFIRTKQHKKKEKKQHKNSNIQPNLHIHQTSGTQNQQLNTQHCGINTVLNILSLV